MKRFLNLILFCSITASAFTQVPRLAKYPISDSGAFAYFPAAPEFELTYSEDSSKVYTGEVVSDSFNFAGIVVDFYENIGNDKAVNEALLISYLDFLKAEFIITEAAGYGRGHTLESNANAVGVIDYWVDADGVNYQIKGWVTDSMMAVMIIYGYSEYPIFNIAQMYLNGFRFPE